jgi:hypothetical protein
MNLNLGALGFAAVARLLVDNLSYLSMDPFNTASRAVLVQFEPLGIVLAVLAGRVVSLLALGAREMDYLSVFALFSH